MYVRKPNGGKRGKRNDSTVNYLFATFIPLLFNIDSKGNLMLVGSDCIISNTLARSASSVLVGNAGVTAGLLLFVGIILDDTEVQRTMLHYLDITIHYV